jgi:starch-binding outer membrane protein, SusD/RagB family
MKQIIYIIALGLFMASAGCKKFLEEKPLSQVTLENFFRSKFDCDAAMAGMYGGFQQQMVGDAQYKDRYHIWGEFRSDNFDRFKSYSGNVHNEIALNNLTAQNEFGDWSGLYNVIGRANTNIKYIPLAAQYDIQITTDYINAYLAQCYAMRAMCYFYIVRVWGDAPIWTEPYQELSEDPARTKESKNKIINEVILADLQKAYDLITKGQKPTVWYMGEGAICAAMADVYMWKKDYSNAITWIQKLFAAKNPASGAAYTGTGINFLQPTATWKSIFTAPAASIENIWSINWDYTRNGCACMMISWTANNKPIVVDIDTWNRWWTPLAPPADIRVKQTMDVYVSNRDRFLKWYPTATNPTAADAWPATNNTVAVYLVMYRLSDMYLLYAEALNKTGDYTKALTYLNYIRVRAGLTAYTATSPEIGDGVNPDPVKMEDVILQERQWELFGEGKRWFDLVRTDHVLQVMDPILKRRQTDNGSTVINGFGDLRRVVWPVNRAVLNANLKLQQTQPYTD